MMTHFGEGTDVDYSEDNSDLPKFLAESPGRTRPNSMLLHKGSNNEESTSNIVRICSQGIPKMRQHSSRNIDYRHDDIIIKDWNF